jgi:hypothetical protein
MAKAMHPLILARWSRTGGPAQEKFYKLAAPMCQAQLFSRDDEDTGSGDFIVDAEFY